MKCSCGFHYFQPPPPGYVPTSSSNKGIQGLLDKAGALITGGVMGGVSIFHVQCFCFLYYFILCAVELSCNFHWDKLNKIIICKLHHNIPSRN
jgi:hypothetical protein